MVGPAHGGTDRIFLSHTCLRLMLLLCVLQRSLPLETGLTQWLWQDTLVALLSSCAEPHSCLSRKLPRYLVAVASDTWLLVKMTLDMSLLPVRETRARVLYSGVAYNMLFHDVISFKCSVHWRTKLVLLCAFSHWNMVAWVHGWCKQSYSSSQKKQAK